MATGAVWRLAAWTALTDLAGKGDKFTADDVLDRVGHPDVEHGANGGNNAIGNLFREAHRQGLIVPVGDVVSSRQPHRKGGMIRVWVWAGSPAAPRNVDKQPDLFS